MAHNPVGTIAGYDALAYRVTYSSIDGLVSGAFVMVLGGGLEAIKEAVGKKLAEMHPSHAPLLWSYTAVNVSPATYEVA